MLAGKNPLVGMNDDELGPRFPPTSNAYPEMLQRVAHRAAAELDFPFVQKGAATYCFVSGPNYESKAECRFLRNSAGGDCVGMSTVPEIVAAHHSGMKVLCLSLITNKVLFEGTEGPDASHEEVLEAVQERSVQLQTLVKMIVSIFDKEVLPSLPDLPPVTLDVVLGPNKSSSPSSCSAKLLLGIPVHCWMQSAALLAAGIVIGTRIQK
mmetsp:Transcript_3493/g.4669  ORF Transcript_3493/g.4669 Transcript_3493/m.4669 type:complete len:209 (-) Transcript_3493:141-767(-)